MEPQRTDLPTVAFVCVHNSCRSQMAEALGRLLAPDAFRSTSAGTQVVPRINPDAARLVRERYGYDMEAAGQRSKLLDEIDEPDVVVLMGCNVACPAVRGRHVENWGLDDPTGQGDAAFAATADAIEKNVRDLRRRILAGEL